MTSPRQIGAALRTERSASGLTQAELAQLVGTSERTIRDIEKGSGASSLDLVIRVAAALGLSFQVGR